MIDPPKNFPTKQPDDRPLKPLPQILLERRATRSFKPDPVPDEYLEAILRLGTQAPSGYNLQPWRLIVVREEATRKRLMAAAYNQPKVGEAPVVIIACGMKEQWKQSAREVFEEGARRGAGSGDPEKYMQGAFQFLDAQAMNMWVTKHTMIAFTTMMLLAEAYGFDTAPMEGFDPAAVKREFAIPDDAEVIALLAIGRGKEPDKPYGGRFALDRVVFSERYGQPWPGAPGSAR